MKLYRQKIHLLYKRNFFMIVMENEILISQDNLNVDEALKNFEPISLNEMKSVELMDRAEMKYLVSKEMLVEILQELADKYKVLEIEGQRKNNYNTIYFDTPDFEMYHKHHNGALNRHKIRMRKYLDSDLSFVEVKFKDNKKRTNKKRIPIPTDLESLDRKSNKFVGKKSPFSSENLKQVLWNYYSRITLVSKNRVERLTIDTNLEFYDGDKKKHIALPNLAIVEVKQEGFSQKSDFVKLMHEKLVRPMGFSKYCIGVCSVYEGVKTNNFKEKLLMVNKLGGVQNE